MPEEQDSGIYFKVTKKFKEKIDKRSEERGFNNRAEYIRHVLRQDIEK